MSYLRFQPGERTIYDEIAKDGCKKQLILEDRAAAAEAAEVVALEAISQEALGSVPGSAPCRHQKYKLYVGYMIPSSEIP